MVSILRYHEISESTSRILNPCSVSNDWDRYSARQRPAVSDSLAAHPDDADPDEIRRITDEVIVDDDLVHASGPVDG